MLCLVLELQDIRRRLLKSPRKTRHADLVVVFTVLLIKPPTGTEQIGVLGFNKPLPARRQRRWDPPHLSVAERGGRRIYYWKFVSVGGSGFSGYFWRGRIMWNSHA